MCQNTQHTAVMPNFIREQSLGGRVAGVDEVGRGPLAGPVVAAAVVFALGVPADLVHVIKDSKKLRPSVRESIATRLAKAAKEGDGVDIGIGAASVFEVDFFNVHQATHLAMQRAVARLSKPPDHILVDGNTTPHFNGHTREHVQAVIGGDRLSLSIAAASIVAKVMRDRIMARLAIRWADYAWQQNAGYGTVAHRQAIQTRGISPHHRKTFGMVREYLRRENMDINRGNKWNLYAAFQHPAPKNTSKNTSKIM